MNMEPRWDDTDKGKPKNSVKNFASTTFSTTNPTRTVPSAVLFPNFYLKTEAESSFRNLLIL
jgi:hypothetical protein